MKRPCDLSDHDHRCARVSKSRKHGHDLAEHPGRTELTHTLDRPAPELGGDLWPPRAVLREEVSIELQSACPGHVLHVLESGLAITALPTRDRRLPAPQP